MFHFYDYQFGFFDAGGCNKTIFAFANTDRYFRNRHSNVNLAELDVIKAFDKVNQYNVLQRLLECGFPLKLVNVFFLWYKNMKSCILWGKSMSKFLTLIRV